VRRILVVIIMMLAAGHPGAPASAQSLGMSFDQAAYVTCQDAQAMPREARIAFALALVQRASAQFGVSYVEGSPLDEEIATLLRAGCTVYPGAYMHAIAATAVRRAANVVLPSGPVGMPPSFDAATFLTCQQYAEMASAERDALAFDLAVHAGRHYGRRFDDTPSSRAKLSEGLTPLVYGACQLAPDFHIYAVIARAVRATAAAD
jgi:hypothetical protein